MPTYWSEHAALSFQLNTLSVRGTNRTRPALGVDLGAPLACRERGDLAAEGVGGELGCTAGATAALLAGSLSQCRMSAPARIKRYCSQPKNCQGSTGQYRRLTALETARAPSPTHTSTHANSHSTCPSDRHGEGYQKAPLTSGCPLASSRGPLRLSEGWKAMDIPTGWALRYSSWHIRAQR